MVNLDGGCFIDGSDLCVLCHTMDPPRKKKKGRYDIAEEARNKEHPVPIGHDVAVLDLKTP